MSRLDDELKVAFQRQEPSPDFAARVLARINEAPAAPLRPSLWQRLSRLVAMPTWRFAAVTAVAVLLIVVGLALLRSRLTAAQNGDNQRAQQESGEGKATVKTPDPGTQAVTIPANAPVPSPPQPRAVKSYYRVRHSAPVIAQQAPPSAEAVAAKEKVMFALQITSDALNDVQRAISDDRTREENPEPVHNR